jgi:hypothetical protein
MKVICTRRNDDGSFNEVGMSTRHIIEARDELTARVKARPFAPCRLELFGPNFYAEPFKVLYL